VLADAAGALLGAGALKAGALEAGAADVAPAADVEAALEAAACELELLVHPANATDTASVTASADHAPGRDS
jgi:hypothetical protein